MLEISMTHILKLMGTKTILKDLNIHLYENERVGLIGPNGCGKSTILKLFAGIIQLKLFPGSWSPGYDYGFIHIPKNTVVAYLNQEPTYETSVSQVLRSSFKNLLVIEKKLRQLEKDMAVKSGSDLDQVFDDYNQLTHEFELRGGYDFETRINKIVKGMALDHLLDLNFNQLSGGEKTRVELSKLLILNPDVLLLDEPTNHLDHATIDWLENYLKSYKGIVMIVSHDRYFLDQVTTHTIEIEDLTCHKYEGNYSRFKEQKDELVRIQADQYQVQQKEIAAMKKKIQRLREYNQNVDHNKFFKRAASIQNKLDRLDRIKQPTQAKTMRVSLNQDSRSGKETLVIKDLYKAFDQVLFENIHETIYYGERVALLGDNGCGKSTLIKMLLKQEEADAGYAKLGAGVKLAYLPQYITFDNENESLLDCFKGNRILSDGKCREYLSKFNFFGKDVFTQVKALSGGERVRLKLAKLLYEDVNLLILDEPTNHLDIMAIEAIEEALMAFEGTIFFISHDRYFTDRLAERKLLIKDHQLLDLRYDKETPKKEDQALLRLEEKLEKINHQLSYCDDDTFFQLMHEKETLENTLETLYLEKCNHDH